MNHVVLLAGTLIWVGVNFFVWSWKQEPAMLFWQSMVLGGVMFPALFWSSKAPLNNNSG
ncbi:MAG TPA: hypothetical protein VHD59_07210 [Pseudolabrys sp.]|nr:hypothetical protein [Pseudolabrys sp.]